MPAEWYTLRASAEGVVLLDQSRLPSEEIYRTCTTVEEVALAIEMGCDAEDIGLTVHPHPTLSETVAMAAEAYSGTITDLYLPRRT